MSASPLNFLRSGPPPPNVVLLPDALFFTRSMPLASGATAAEGAAQIELALESISPFPLAQLYYGWFWPPGAERAFVFAAYRRRFTSEQTAEWQGAELVLPSFATVLGIGAEPATTVLINSPEALTAVHWESDIVPARALCRPVAAEASEEDRAQVRDELLRLVGGSKTVIDLAAPPMADPARSDREVVFRAGDLVSTIAAGLVTALDVRDKGELAALGAGRRRDILLWRTTLAAAAMLILFGLGELALFGGGAWQQIRHTELRVYQPLVEKIISLDEQARRIEELRTKRLLPLEMVTVLVGEDGSRKPSDIQFTRVDAGQARGLYTVRINGVTNNTGQVGVYETALEKLPEIETVDAQVDQMRGNVTTFTLTVTFKPDAVKPAAGAAG